MMVMISQQTESKNTLDDFRMSLLVLFYLDVINEWDYQIK